MGGEKYKAPATELHEGFCPLALFHWQPCVSATGNNDITLSFTRGDRLCYGKGASVVVSSLSGPWGDVRVLIKSPAGS